MLRPIDLDPLMPYPPMAHKDVPKSLILAAFTGAEKTTVNTAQTFVGGRAEIYRFRIVSWLLPSRAWKDLPAQGILPFFELRECLDSFSCLCDSLRDRLCQIGQIHEGIL